MSAEKKKGKIGRFFARIAEKLDKKMEEKSKASCCCCGPQSKSEAPGNCCGR